MKMYTLYLESNEWIIEIIVKLTKVCIGTKFYKVYFITGKLCMRIIGIIVKWTNLCMWIIFNVFYFTIGKLCM